MTFEWWGFSLVLYKSQFVWAIEVTLKKSLFGAFFSSSKNYNRMWWLLTNVVCSGGPPHAIWRDADVMKNLCSSSSLQGPFFTHRHTTKYWFSCITYEWGSLTNLVRKSPYITFFGESSQEKNNVLEQKKDEDLRLWEKPKMAIKSRPFSVSLARDTKYLFFFPTMLKNGKNTQAHRSRALNRERHVAAQSCQKSYGKEWCITYHTSPILQWGKYRGVSFLWIPPPSLNLCNLKRNPGTLGNLLFSLRYHISWKTFWSVLESL